MRPGHPNLRPATEAGSLADCVWNHSSLRRSSGNLLETTVDAFGTHVVMDGGIPVITDVVSDAQTQGSATPCSSSSAVRFGMEGVLRRQNGELQVGEVGDLKTKDAGRCLIST